MKSSPIVQITFTVTRASAETSPSLYYQSLIDFMLVVILIGSL